MYSFAFDHRPRMLTRSYPFPWQGEGIRPGWTQ